MNRARQGNYVGVVGRNVMPINRAIPNIWSKRDKSFS